MLENQNPRDNWQKEWDERDAVELRQKSILLAIRFVPIRTTIEQATEIANEIENLILFPSQINSTPS